MVGKITLKGLTYSGLIFDVLMIALSVYLVFVSHPLWMLSTCLWIVIFTKHIIELKKEGVADEK